MSSAISLPKGPSTTVQAMTWSSKRYGMAYTMNGLYTADMGPSWTTAISMVPILRPSMVALSLPSWLAG